MHDLDPEHPHPATAARSGSHTPSFSMLMWWNRQQLASRFPRWGDGHDNPVGRKAS